MSTVAVARRLAFPDRWALIAGLAILGLAAVALWRGPGFALLLALAAAALLFLVPRLAFSLGVVVLVNALAVVTQPVFGVTLANYAERARVAGLVLLGLQVLRVVLEGRISVRRALGPRVLLLGLLPLTILAAPVEPVDALNALPFAVIVGGTALIGFHVAGRRDRAERALWAIAGALTVLLLMNVVLLPFASGSITVQECVRFSCEAGRFTGLMENPNTIGLLGAAGFAALAGLGLVVEGRRWMRLTCFALALGWMVLVVLSGSRGGLGGLLAAALVLLLLATPRVLSAGILVALGAASAMAVLLTTNLGSALISVFRLGDAGGSGRVDIWDVSVEFIQIRPLLGYGYGSEPMLIGPLGDDPRFDFRGTYAGNIFVDAGLELGIIGILAVFVAVVAPLLGALRGRWEFAVERHIHAAFAAIAAALAVDAQAESFGLVPGSAGVVPLWLALSMCSALTRMRQRRLPLP